MAGGEWSTTGKSKEPSFGPQNVQYVLRHALSSSIKHLQHRQKPVQHANWQKMPWALPLLLLSTTPVSCFYMTVACLFMDRSAKNRITIPKQHVIDPKFVSFTASMEDARSHFMYKSHRCEHNGVKVRTEYAGATGLHYVWHLIVDDQGSSSHGSGKSCTEQMQSCAVSLRATYVHHGVTLYDNAFIHIVCGFAAGNCNPLLIPTLNGAYSNALTGFASGICSPAFARQSFQGLCTRFGKRFVRGLPWKAWKHTSNATPSAIASFEMLTRQRTLRKSIATVCTASTETAFLTILAEHTVRTAKGFPYDFARCILGVRRFFRELSAIITGDDRPTFFQECTAPHVVALRRNQKYMHSLHSAAPRLLTLSLNCTGDISDMTSCIVRSVFSDTSSDNHILSESVPQLLQELVQAAANLHREMSLVYVTVSEALYCHSCGILHATDISSASRVPISKELYSKITEYLRYIHIKHWQALVTILDPRLWNQHVAHMLLCAYDSELHAEYILNSILSVDMQLISAYYGSRVLNSLFAQHGASSMRYSHTWNIATPGKGQQAAIIEAAVSKRTLRANRAILNVTDSKTASATSGHDTVRAPITPPTSWECVWTVGCSNKGIVRRIIGEDTKVVMALSVVLYVLYCGMIILLIAVYTSSYPSCKWREEYLRSKFAVAFQNSA